MGLGLPPLPPFLPPPPFFFASIRAGGPLRACSDACSEALGAMRRAVQEHQHKQRRTTERSISDAAAPDLAPRSSRRAGLCGTSLGRPLDASKSGLSTRVACVVERLLGVASAAPQQPQRALSNVLVPRVDEGA